MTAHRTTATASLTDLLFEEAGVGLCLVAPDGTVVRANAAWLRSTGFAREQAVGENIVDLFPDTRDMALAVHARARAGHRVEVPRHARRVNGRETWWEGSIAPVAMEGGTGLLITAREVTPGAGEQRTGPVTPRASSSEIVDTLLARVPEGITIATGPDVVTLANSKYAEELLLGSWNQGTGFSREEWLARVEHYLPDERTRAPVEDLPLWRAARRGESVRDAELIVKRPDGTRISVVCNAEPIRDAEGDVVGGIVAWRDVTDQKQQQAALRASEERFRLLADAMPQIVCVLAPDGGVEYVNRAWTAFSGLGLDATARAGWACVVHRDDVDAARECRYRALKRLSPQDVELRYQGADGTYRWFLSRLAPVVEGGRVVRFIGAAMDIEARKRAEQALQRSQELLRSTMQHFPTAIVFKDRDGRFIDVNAAVERDLCAPREQLLGRTLHDFVDDRQAADRLLAREREVMERGRAMQFEDETPLPSRVVHHASTVFPLVDDGGRVYGTGVISHDIAAMKRAERELREANAKLVKADQRKDEFLGMLSHELRNPLAPIRNSSYILRHAQPGSDQANRAQQVIERQTDHLARLVDDLLDVTRISRGKIELRRSKVDLREVVMRAAEDFRLSLDDRGVAFRTTVPDTPMWANVDATRITQVVGNLLTNAAKFTRRGDEVDVALSVEDGQARIAVRDTGAGIDPVILPTIFEPFVQGQRTLARTEGGLGLGLALVKGIAELHGGSASVTSAGKGKGAQFAVRFPLLEHQASADVDGRRAGRRRSGRRVLVVDDNVDAAESLAEIVRMLGHDAEIAYDGPSAMEKVRTGRPNVVLCDIGLPGMSGYEVAEAIRAAAIAGVQLVAVSGYAQPEDVKRAMDAGFDTHVAKPPDLSAIEKLLA